MATIPWVSHRVSPAPAAADGTPRRLKQAAFSSMAASGCPASLSSQMENRLRTDIPSHSFVGFQRDCRTDRRRGNLRRDCSIRCCRRCRSASSRAANGTGRPSYLLYIVPAEVMERRDVPAWRFETAPWNHKKDVKRNYWVNVSSSNALTLKERDEPGRLLSQPERPSRVTLTLEFSNSDIAYSKNCRVDVPATRSRSPLARGRRPDGNAPFAACHVMKRARTLLSWGTSMIFSTSDNSNPTATAVPIAVQPR